jgi:hypothetical protein
MAIPQMRYGQLGYRICGIADRRHLTDNSSPGNHTRACVKCAALSSLTASK